MAKKKAASYSRFATPEQVKDVLGQRIAKTERQARSARTKQALVRRKELQPVEPDEDEEEQKRIEFFTDRPLLKSVQTKATEMAIRWESFLVANHEEVSRDVLIDMAICDLLL